jgi:hypothetical protein
VLSLEILYRHVVLYDHGKFIGCLHPVPSPTTLAFDYSGQSRHFRFSPPSDSREAMYFVASLRFTFATTYRLVRPPVGADRVSPADEDFYFRASDGLVTRSAAGYSYRGNWASYPDGTFTRKHSN